MALGKCELLETWRDFYVLQCVAVCCSVLQCTALYCSVFYCVALCCSALQCVAVRCSALQCVAVRCSAPQCVAVLCNMAWITWLRARVTFYFRRTQKTCSESACQQFNLPQVSSRVLLHNKCNSQLTLDKSLPWHMRPETRVSRAVATKCCEQLILFSKSQLHSYVTRWM